MSPLVLIAGGGTGGHVFPALAVAEALRAAGADVEFVGTARGLESRVVPEAGFALHRVDARPLARKASLATLGLPRSIARATRQVVALIRERRVAAAGVFGGYTSVPLALAAWRTRTPLVVHEQNAVPGLANRLAARWAETVAVSVAASRDRFGDRGRVVVTGNPVRTTFAGLDLTAARAAALATFDLDGQRRTLLVFGGSQGARTLNDAVIGSVGLWGDPAGLQILHSTGRGDHQRVSQAWTRILAEQGADAPRVRWHEFIADMPAAYAAADVVVCRAGASTIAELTALGLPSVLVPYPHATDDHQTANARVVADVGAATLVPDQLLTPTSLVEASEPWLTDDRARATAAVAARSLGRPDAADQVADVILHAARQGSSR